MAGKRWVSILGVLIVGGILGAGAMIASLEVNRATSTEAFCTSCHSMGHLAADPHYINSAHRSNAASVLPNCADCHIPKTNWFVETYAHITGGARDILAEKTHNFDDPAVWEKRRIALAHEVREEMRRSDSVTCRSCHTPASVHPATMAGKAAHALLAEGGMTCIDCHINLVHAPVPPSAEFLRGSGLGARKK